MRVFYKNCKIYTISKPKKTLYFNNVNITIQKYRYLTTLFTRNLSYKVSSTIYKITFINFEHETNFTELVMEHMLVYTELSLVKADQMFDQNRLSTTCVYK